METVDVWKIRRDGKDESISATWIDTTQKHLVALVEAKARPVASPRRSSNMATGEELGLQILRFPRKGSYTRYLDASETWRMAVPGTMAWGWGPDVDTEGGFNQRIPLLVKFSLDLSLLALQTSKTCVRILVVKGNNKQHSRYWTVDLSSGDPNPVASATDAMPKIRQIDGLDDDILSGGVLWSDHGGSSQDFVLVSKRAVRCYKVSLARNMMSLTHTFSHPAASAVWWEPFSRALVVGSFGLASMAKTLDADLDGTVLYMRTFFLHSTPKPPDMIGIAIPRFELPPPDRLSVFAVGMGRITGKKMLPFIELNDMALVSLYNRPYLVELTFLEPSYILRIHFHELCRSSKTIRMRQCTIRLPQPVGRWKEKGGSPALVGVVDNLLCLVLCDVQLFLDISHEFEDGIVSFQVPLAQDSLLSQPDLSFVAPDLILDSADIGMVRSVELDVSKAVRHIEETADAVSVLLRREVSSTKHLTVKLLRQVVEGQDMDSCRKCLQEVALAYHRNPKLTHRDDKTSQSLAYACTLSPSSVLLLHEPLCSDWPIDIQERSQDPRYLERNLIKQHDLLGSILLPLCRSAVSTRDANRLEHLLHVTVEYGAALRLHSQRPSMALIILIVALYWRLGRSSHIMYLIQSLLHSKLYSPKEGRMLADAMFLVVQNPNDVPSEPIEEALGPLLRSDPCGLIRYYLQRSLPLNAMVMCSALLLEGNKGVIARARGQMSFQALVGIVVPCMDSKMYFALYQFLQRWDPDCLVMRERLLSATVIFRQLAGHEGASVTFRCIRRRRPSWIASSIIERTTTTTTSSPASVAGCWSDMADYFPNVFVGLPRTRREWFRTAFGYSPSSS